jgi:hypothetical protein
MNSLELMYDAGPPAVRFPLEILALHRLAVFIFGNNKYERTKPQVMHITRYSVGS